jgi:WD40 repeat protein
MRRIQMGKRQVVVASLFCLTFASHFALAAKNVAEKIAVFKEEDDVASLEFNADSNELAVGTFVTLPIHFWAWKGSPHVARSVSKPHVVLDYTSKDSIRYSPDDKFVAVAHGLAPAVEGGGVVRMFDASTGSIIKDFAEPSGGGIYSRIAFSKDQQLFLRSYDSNAPANRNQLIAYRIATWEELWGLRIAPLNVISMAISSDGRFAALGGITLGPGVVHNAQILIVDLEEKRVVRTIDHAFPAENRVEQVAWNPDGIHLAVGGIVGGTFAGSDAVRIFDISSGQIVSRESASPADISFLRYTPDGKYLIEGGFKSSVRIWDGTHQKLIQELPNRHANALAVSRDSSYFAVSDGARVEVWKFR